MPKLKCSDIVRLYGFVKEFGEKHFTTDGIILFCKLCEVKVTAEKRFIVEQRCNTAKHKSCANHPLQHYRKRRLS
jgi:hemerythrin superfamily protein